MEKMQLEVRDNMRTAQQHQKKWYDKGTRERSFQPGQLRYNLPISSRVYHTGRAPHPPRTNNPDLTNPIQDILAFRDEVNRELDEMLHHGSLLRGLPVTGHLQWWLFKRRTSHFIFVWIAEN